MCYNWSSTTNYFINSNDSFIVLKRDFENYICMDLTGQGFKWVIDDDYEGQRVITDGHVHD